jgi:hypothetical protein
VLGPRPGQKIRSGVVPPPQDIKMLHTDPDTKNLHGDLDDLGNEIPAKAPQVGLGDTSMIDLDD